jgi:hypothetical protein
MILVIFYLSVVYYEDYTQANYDMLKYKINNQRQIPIQSANILV